MAVDLTTFSLLIAFVALFVTLAQVTQQYLVTGQLIRICDSVVYGKMPGQGRRIWQFSQFRFRVVYCIPQINLPSDLWDTISFHTSSDAKNHLSLPELRHPSENITGDSQEMTRKKSGPQMFTVRSTIAGEASWVSFTRAVQHSSGKSLKYELVEGDADRCPTDLPVVPMQLSMRDVAVIAIMAGMKCTDVSFQHQSLSMQGTAGTITSSQHPVLGALIHFSPKRPHEMHGFRINDGSISHQWMARMWDIITVAGYQYDLRDRKHFEEDEGPWIKRSSDRTLSRKQEIPLPESSGLRRRQGVNFPETIDQSISNEVGPKSLLEILPKELAADNSIDQSEVALHRQQDGDWSFVRIMTETDLFLAKSENLYLPPPNSTHSQLSYRSWYQRPLNYLRKHLKYRRHKPGLVQNPSILPISEHIESNPCEERQKSAETDIQSKTAKKNLDVSFTTPSKNNLRNTRGISTKELLKSYIKERQETANQSSANAHPELKPPRFLLTDHEGPTISESSSQILPDNPGTEQERNVTNARAEHIVQKWQDVVRRRREEREKKAEEEDHEMRSNLQKKIDSSYSNRSRQMSSRSSKSSQSHFGPSKLRDGLRESGRLQSVETDRRSNRLASTGRKSENSIKSRGRRHSPSPLGFRRTQPSADSFKARGRQRDYSPTQPFESLDNPASVEYGDKPVLRQPSKDVFEGTVNEIDTRIWQPGLSNSKKGVLKKPKDRFPEEESPTREGVAPLTLPHDSDIPSNARWTRIGRKLVNPEALKDGNERFEEGPDYLIVLRVLRKEEIEAYAVRTQEIRMKRKAADDHKIPNLSGNNTSSKASESSEASYSSFERIRSPPLQAEISSIEENILLDSLNADEPSKMAPQTKESDFAPVEGQSDLDPIYESPIESDLSEDRFNFLEESVVACMESKNVENSSGTYSVEAQENEGKSREQDNSRGKYYQPITVLPEKPEIPSLNIGKIDKDDRPKHELRIRRRSTDQTNQSSAFEDELLFLQSDDILKKTRKGIERCSDVIVALKIFRDTQSDQRHDAGEADAIHEQFHKLINTLRWILKSTKMHRDQKYLAEFIVSELQLMILNLEKSISMLETEFGLHEMRLMNQKAQGEAWNNMLLKFREQNSSSLSKHLRITCSLGNELLTNLRGGRLSSVDSDHLKARIQRLSGLRQDFSTTASSRYELVSRPNLEESRRFLSNYDPSSRYAKSIGSHQASDSDDSDLKRSFEKVSDWASKTESTPNFFKEPLENAIGQDSKDQSEISSVEPIELDEESTNISSAVSGKALPVGEANWLWICQADIIPGYFATPWKHLFSEAVCVGAISVILRGLAIFTTESTLKYVSAKESCRDWICAGKTTYPSYAVNAMGGIVIAGTYRPVEFRMFSQSIPPIELLDSYEHQVKRKFYQDTQAIMDNLAELMGLDCWLSFCGRLPEIYDGPSNLLRQLPALVQRIMMDFEFEFANLDRTSDNGGLQIIQDIADSVTGALRKQNLSEPEQLFAMVALLRAAKTALCVVHGTDTTKLRDVFLHDVQVYLA